MGQKFVLKKSLKAGLIGISILGVYELLAYMSMSFADLASMFFIWLPAAPILLVYPNFLRGGIFSVISITFAFWFLFVIMAAWIVFTIKQKIKND